MDAVHASAATGRRQRRLRLRAALSGVLAAGAALAVAELATPLLGLDAAPLDAVGEVVIDAAPPWLKDFAVDTFGTADKPLLVGGIATVVAGFAALLGVASLRRRWVGLAGIALFAMVGAAAALVRPEAGPVAVLPTVVGAVVGGGVLLLLVGTLRSSPSPAGAPTDDGDATAEPHAPTAASDTEPAPASAVAARDVAGFDRRRFVVLAGAAAALSAGGVAGGRWLAVTRTGAADSRAAVELPTPASPAPPLPTGVDLELEGVEPFFTPAGDFYRIDTVLTSPRVDASTWRLRIHGLGVDERVYTYADLLERDDLMERDITLACVSNPVGGSYVGNARWIGVPLAALLAEAGVRSPGDGGPADQIVSRSQDGMTIGTPVADVLDGRDAMLALGMNGVPLPVDHGFPVRMVVPGLYGYVSACKWLVELELTTFDAFDAYWVPRGWAAEGPIKTQSRIDTPRDGARVAGGAVAVAGVAWAQNVGVDAVEVRVDGGEWQQAELAPEDTADTWRQWVLEWDAEPGDHEIQVRATDRDGQPQTEDEAPSRPDGATGFHTITVTVS